MNERKLQFRVGIVVLATLVIAGLLIFLASDRPGWFFSDVYQIKIRFPEAPGVAPGTPVRKYGKLIGRVETVEIVEDGVLVTVSIDKDQKLPASDTAEVSSSLIGGDAVIEFVSRPKRENQDLPGGRAEEIPPPDGASGAGGATARLPRIQLALFQQQAELEIIQPGETIEGNVRPGPMQILVDMQGNLEQTIESLGEAGDAVARVANRIDSILAESDLERLRRIFTQMDEALGGFTRTMESLNNVLGDEELQAELRQGIEDLPEAVAAIRDTMNRVERAAGAAENNLRNLEGLTGPIGERGDQIAGNLQSAAGNLDRLLAQVAVFTRGINTQEGTLGRLLYSRELYDDVARIVNNVEFLTVQLRPIVKDLQVFSDKIARQPGRLGAAGAVRQEAPLK